MSNGKLEFVPRDHVNFPITCRLLFIISTHKLVVSPNFLSIRMKIEFSSQRREMLLFLTTNMAAVTSRANQQYFEIVYMKQSYTVRAYKS